MTSIGVVVGLEAEARLARAWGIPVVVGGGTSTGAATAAAILVHSVQALVSFGLAGGLDPALQPGTILVPSCVSSSDGTRWSTNADLNKLLGGCTGHTLLGDGPILATIQAKRDARSRGFHAVDLESAAVAAAAQRHGLPFAVLRAVCDPADRPLPRAALVALDAQGRIGSLRVLTAALSNPAELPALIALALDANRARRALRQRVGGTLRR